MNDFQWPNQDLNPGLLASKVNALPTELSMLASNGMLLWSISICSNCFAIAAATKAALGTTFFEL